MSVDKTANEAPVLKRMASILNLFSEGRTSITIDEVGEAIGVSSATAYRYVDELEAVFINWRACLQRQKYRWR
jgi:predicted DNA-binding transcriptional regulator YafY